jgi:hypothetical protein
MIILFGPWPGTLLVIFCAQGQTTTLLNFGHVKNQEILFEIKDTEHFTIIQPWMTMKWVREWVLRLRNVLVHNEHFL